MYRYYHRNRQRTSTPVGILLEYAEGDPQGGTFFGEKQEALQALVKEGIIIEELCEGVESYDVPAESAENLEVREEAEESAENLEEVLISEEEAEGLKFGELRAYARKHGIVGRGRDELVRELKEAGKVT